MESYLTKWGKLKKMVYPRLEYWLLTIICMVGSRQFTSNSLFGKKMVKTEKNCFFVIILYSSVGVEVQMDNSGLGAIGAP